MNSEGLRMFCLNAYQELRSIFPDLQTLCREKHGLVFTYHHRLKSEKSIKAKLDAKQSCEDVIGFRLINPWTAEIRRLAEILQTEFKKWNILVERQEVRERGRVIYLYCVYDEVPFEVQLWPSLLYYCFEYEHDRVYKPPQPLTEEQRLRAKLLREEEHMVQDQVDKYVLVPYSLNSTMTGKK